MTEIKTLEHFWHKMVLTIPQAKEVKGAVFTCYPKLPIPQCNHVADVRVTANEAEHLLEKATAHFQSRGSAFIRFRITPLTRPTTFCSFLESRGFEKKSEESVMVFKGGHLGDKLNPDIKVSEISMSEADVGNRIVFMVFGFPTEWKNEMDRLILSWMRIGGRFYLGYVDGKPVGTSFLGSAMKTGGIFNVGTMKEYRGRGVGTTLTAHTVMESIKEGNQLHTLQTVKGGNAEQLYKKIGFEIDHTASWYVKKL